MTAPAEVRQFVAELAAAFRVTEHDPRFAATINGKPVDRDKAIIAYTLAVLANPQRCGTAAVLEHIDRKRATHG